MQSIRDIRERLGMTQEAIADGIGVTQSNVSHYEQGRQQMPPDVARRLIALAHSLGHELTFDDIYAGPRSNSGEPTPSTERAA